MLDLKKLVITSIVAVLCVGFCVFCTVYVRGTAEKAEQYTQNLETLVKKGDQKAALNEVSLFEDYWKTNQDMLSTILHHEMLEEIEQSIAVTKACLEYSFEDGTDFWNQLAIVKKQIENLKKSEMPSWENIL